MGKMYSLLQVELIYTSQPKHQIPLSTLPDGLTALNEIRLTFFNFKDRAQIETVLPINGPMSNVAILVLQCQTNVTVYCGLNSIYYNQTRLQQLFPNLQTFSIAGAYPLSEGDDVRFPWAANRMPLPLNLSKSVYEKNLIRQDSASEDNLNTRSLVFDSHTGLNVSHVCPLDHDKLDYILLKRLGQIELPADCFQPTVSAPSQLRYLDLSSSYIGTLHNNTFKNLTALHILIMVNCKLTELQVGLFDYLVNLRVLDLNRNSISHLYKNLFAKLMLLEHLYINHNNISVIDYPSFPHFSLNLRFVDMANNVLTSFPPDCFSLPRLIRCDLDHNNIRASDEKELKQMVELFDPIKLYFVQPLPYYGAERRASDVGPIHENDQCHISVRNNTIKTFGFKSSWPL